MKLLLNILNDKKYNDLNKGIYFHTINIYRHVFSEINDILSIDKNNEIKFPYVTEQNSVIKLINSYVKNQEKIALKQQLSINQDINMICINVYNKYNNEIINKLKTCISINNIDTNTLCKKNHFQLLNLNTENNTSSNKQNDNTLSNKQSNNTLSSNTLSSNTLSSNTLSSKQNDASSNKQSNNTLSNKQSNNTLSSKQNSNILSSKQSNNTLSSNTLSSKQNDSSINKSNNISNNTLSNKLHNNMSNIKLNNNVKTAINHMTYNIKPVAVNLKPTSITIKIDQKKTLDILNTNTASKGINNNM